MIMIRLSLKIILALTVTLSLRIEAIKPESSAQSKSSPPLVYHFYTPPRLPISSSSHDQFTSSSSAHVSPIPFSDRSASISTTTPRPHSARKRGRSFISTSSKSLLPESPVPSHSPRKRSRRLISTSSKLLLPGSPVPSHPKGSHHQLPPPTQKQQDEIFLESCPKILQHKSALTAVLLIRVLPPLFPLLFDDPTVLQHLVGTEPMSILDNHAIATRNAISKCIGDILSFQITPTTCHQFPRKGKNDMEYERLLLSGTISPDSDQVQAIRQIEFQARLATPIMNHIYPRMQSILLTILFRRWKDRLGRSSETHHLHNETYLKDLHAMVIYWSRLVIYADFVSSKQLDPLPIYAIRRILIEVGRNIRGDELTRSTSGFISTFSRSIKPDKTKGERTQFDIDVIADLLPKYYHRLHPEMQMDAQHIQRLTPADTFVAQCTGFGWLEDLAEAKVATLDREEPNTLVSAQPFVRLITSLPRVIRLLFYILGDSSHHTNVHFSTEREKGMEGAKHLRTYFEKVSEAVSHLPSTFLSPANAYIQALQMCLDLVKDLTYMSFDSVKKNQWTGHYNRLDESYPSTPELLKFITLLYNVIDHVCNNWAQKTGLYGAELNDLSTDAFHTLHPVVQRIMKGMRLEHLHLSRLFRLA
ncbi:hypothetical protein BJ684DRAFT_16620 [Piptocephalis cylindrospora]|uniref:Uncharacterized protein n=1 Tax=Piptocephalis cylindrospora TaxID=1907219 RepID=A0A4P9Y578_9FUNG|nr:hypothetical protein BJ684DRAFT_16620 [Piptocephalis cylindrospora]|eukprot:RKP12940.1 hypothetical protein BJ684DRAFT_16620 [Piptocephalis cylindrospora]